MSVRKLAKRLEIVTAVALALVAAGVAARFVDLDSHYYFHDEAVTSLRMSGNTYADFDRFLAGRTITAADLGSFQRSGTRDLWATIHSLAINDPQHPPLFYGLARLWAQVVGASITAMRALAALLSLLALVAGGWLAWELFHSRRVVWLSVALLAISPFQLLYAREAREYGLWVAAVAASGAALLFALRARSPWAWLLYSLLLTAALYTFPNTTLVIAGQAVFLLLHARTREVLRPFVAAILVAVLLYLPWIGVMVLQRGAFAAGTDWSRSRIPVGELLRSWLVVSGLPFLDKPGGPSSVDVAWGVAFSLVIVLEAAALLFLWRRGPRPAWLFLATLIAATVLPLMAADIVFGGVRSTVPRFLAPAYLGISIVLAFALSEALVAASRRTALVGGAVALSVVVAASVSYQKSAFAAVWWNQDDGRAAENLAAARVLERADRPLLLSPATLPLLELSHYLKPATQIRVTLSATQVTDSDELFLYGSPREARVAARLWQRRHLQPVPLVPPCCGAGFELQPAQLWRLR